MSDMECESLLLDDAPGKYNEDSDCGDICNADEDALLADLEEDFTSHKPHSHSRIKFEGTHKGAEQDSEDILDLGTHIELDEEDAAHKRNFNVMTVSSTTPTEQELSLSRNEDGERQTRFKQERQITTSTKKYAHIPDSLDEVVINYPPNTHHQNKKTFRGRGRGYHSNNHQRNKPESKTVLINPHFKGKVTVPNNNRLNWDARQRLNHNYNKNQVGHIQPLLQQNQNRATDTIWNNVQNVQQQQHPPPPLFQQFGQQVPQHQMFNQQLPVQHHQVPNNWNQFQGNTFQQISPHQMIHTFEPPQQCFIQPLQDSYYSPPPQLPHPGQFNHPPPRFEPPPPQYASEPTQYPQPNLIRTVHYNDPQFIFPQNQLVQPQEPPYVQPLFNQQIQHRNQQTHYMEMNRPNNLQQQTLAVNRRKIGNNSVMMKRVKKRPQVVSKNLHEVLMVQQIPDTTVQDDEDEATKQYRKLIEEQKKKREQILQQKESRRRQAAQIEENALSASIPIKIQETVIPIYQQNLPIVPKSVLQPNRIIQKQEHIRQPVQQTVFNNPVRRLAPTIMKHTNPNIKVINVSNEPIEKQHLSSFLSNRKILAKDESLLDTNIVVISNLADGTTAVKLRKMCVRIGDVKSLQMSPKERQATIQFNSVASAHAFFKKYQRTMLDLSVIQVTLKPLS